jgi:flagellar motor protein MotB
MSQRDEEPSAEEWKEWKSEQKAKQDAIAQRSKQEANQEAKEEANLHEAREEANQEAREEANQHEAIQEKIRLLLAHSNMLQVNSDKVESLMESIQGLQEMILDLEGRLANDNLSPELRLVIYGDAMLLGEDVKKLKKNLDKLLTAVFDGSTREQLIEALHDFISPA